MARRRTLDSVLQEFGILPAPPKEAFEKGDKIRILSNTYEGFTDIPIGTTGTVTKSGSLLIGIRLSNGFQCRAWMITDARGVLTVEVI